MGRSRIPGLDSWLRLLFVRRLAGARRLLSQKPRRLLRVALETTSDGHGPAKTCRYDGIVTRRRYLLGGKRASISAITSLVRCCCSSGEAAGRTAPGAVARQTSNLIFASRKSSTGVLSFFFDGFRGELGLLSGRFPVRDRRLSENVADSLGSIAPLRFLNLHTFDQLFMLVGVLNL